MSSTYSLIDYEGLIRGEGEWKNMQEILCRTFRIIIDQNQQQSETINKLEKQLHLMKEEINHRPTWDDVDRLIETRILNDKKKNSKFINEVDQLKIQLAHFKSDLEKKVSVNYLEMSLNKKMDRSEVITKSIGSSKAVNTGIDEDIKKLKLDFLQVKADVESLSDMVGTTFQSFDIPRLFSDVSILKSQVDHATAAIRNVLTKEEIAVLVQQKASRSEVEVQISQKADSVTFSKAVQRIEQVLEQHEKLITSLRFRSNDNLLFSGALSSSVADSRKLETDYELEHGLKNGRLESIVIEMWNNMSGLQAEVKNSRKELNYVLDSIGAVKQALEKSANVEKVELLGIVVEEQRQRIDAVIQGTTKIAPIFKTLSRFEEHLNEMGNFLCLPQGKTLNLQLDEIRHHVQELKEEVALSREFFEVETKQKVDTLTYQADSLEMRWKNAQNDREKLDFLANIISLNGTGYTNYRDVINELLEIKALLTGDGISSEIAALSVLPRLQTIETKLQSQERHLEKYKIKIRNLKAAVVSLESYAALGSSARFTGAHKQKEHPSTPVLPQEDVERSGTADFRTPALKEDLGNNTPRASAEKQTPTSTVVDFDAALSQLFTSIDEIKIPVRKATSLGSNSNPVSLHDVDQRLQQLASEKERLRKMLLSQT